MSLSAALLPRDHGLSQPHSLTPSLLSLRYEPSLPLCLYSLLPLISHRKTPQHLGRSHQLCLKALRDF